MPMWWLRAMITNVDCELINYICLTFNYPDDDDDYTSIALLLLNVNQKNMIESKKEEEQVFLCK